MEGQKLLILAVVQDGDLKERYHHSSPLRSGDWFHKTAALWPRYILSKAASGPEKKPAFFDLENATASELAAELIQRMDRQEHYADLIQPTVDRGMAAALACAEGLSLDKQERIEPLYGIIAMAARCRRAHPELLKLYDPLAYEVFYTEAGVESQKRFALALKLKAWTPRVLEALINAAPRPTLEWLKEQAGAQHPEIEKACRMLKEWSTHVYFKRESQCVDELRSIILKLAACERFSADPGVYAVLIRCAGETGASEMSPLALKALSHSDVSVRAEACTALQRFGGERMPAELLSLAGREHEPRVLIRLAEALEAWHDDESAGEAALNIFKRCKDAEVRRALLFSCMHAEWPARTALLLEAFNDAECRNNGVLGVALQAVAMHSADELEKQTLKLTTEYQTAPAPLIEALGAVNDEASANYLAAALKTSKNISVRLKIFLSLEKNESAIARAALLNELKSTTDPLLAQQLVAIAGRIKLPHAESVLLSLAADTTAPLPVRVQCLWSLGAFRSADVRQKLERLHAQADVLFSSGEGSDSGTLEKVEQARMLLKMALLEQGDAAAETELAALFDTATPSTRISMLMLLSSSKRDHAVIQRGLHSADFAVVLAAIHAASAANPQKYHREFLRLKDAPFLTALLKTGLDLNDMPEVLDGAIAAGK
ncbi:MAG TPA: HEAT repeat domain-containing protein [Planctomycetota bacterium]|nr:HEAT repeat domain-containing protein [Planctomycetota bacterium]